MPTTDPTRALCQFQRSLEIYDETLAHFITSIDLLEGALKLMVGSATDAGVAHIDITEVLDTLHLAKATFQRPLPPKEPTSDSTD